MSSLNPQSLANLYTLEEIKAKVTLYTEQLESAMVKSYDKDSSQGRQKVEASDLDMIESILASWVEAYNIKKGFGSTNIVSASFNNRRFM